MTARVNPWLVLVLVCLAQFMVVLDATIVNVALPTIQQDLDMSDTNLQWIVNAYTLLFGGFLLLGGRAGDPPGASGSSSPASSSSRARRSCVRSPRARPG
jgi:MFS family permease